MMSNFDSVMRLLAGSDFSDASSGESDAPTGFFSLVEVPKDDAEFLIWLSELAAHYEAPVEDVQEWREALADERGWFIVTIVSSGLVFPSRYDSEEDAREAYAALEAQYEEYAIAEEDGFLGVDNTGEPL